MITVPKTPSEWKRLAESHSIPDLPYHSALHEDADLYTRREIYIDAAQVVQARRTFVEIYTDVLAFSDPKHVFSVADGGYINLNSRVATADTPVELTVNFTGASDAAFSLWAAQLDQPISISTLSGTTPIQLGKPFPNLGAEIRFSKGLVEIVYYKSYPALEVMPKELKKSTQTQLRVSTILFWLSPVVAADLALHVARLCASSEEGAALFMQANALSQQLAVTNTTGPGLSMAPVLNLETYQRTLNGVIDVTAAFQRQYEVFVKSSQDLANQKAAWDTMLQKSKDIYNIDSRLVEDAQKRWKDARDALDTANSALRNDAIGLDVLKQEFETGVWEWQRKKQLEAAAEIIFAVITFAVAIGALCIGDPAPAAKAPAAAAGAVQSIEKSVGLAGELGKLMNTKNMKFMKDSLELFTKVGNTTDAIMKKILLQTGGGRAKIPVMDKDSAEPPPSALSQMAAWDKYTLDVDAQLAFAVDQGIAGASAYRLALKKYAIDGKVVTQSRVESNRAAYEYLERRVELFAAERDFERLKSLLENYQGQEEVARDAAEAFYDRKMSTITSVLVEMRKANWAFKYMALEDSRVVLNPLKTIEDYRADVQGLVQQVEDWKEKRTSDFAPFMESYLASQLGPAALEPVVKSIQEKGVAMFTLSPPSQIGPFKGGSHVRIIGMRAFLIGAKAKDPNKTKSMEVKISSSGVYSDTENNEVFTFVMRPDTRRLKYLLQAEDTSEIEEFDSGVQIDSFIPSGEFADPTPFTNWTVSIPEKDLYDLSGLKDVKLVWKGRMK